MDTKKNQKTVDFLMRLLSASTIITLVLFSLFVTYISFKILGSNGSKSTLVFVESSGILYLIAFFVCTIILIKEQKKYINRQPIRMFFIQIYSIVTLLITLNMYNALSGFVGVLKYLVFAFMIIFGFLTLISSVFYSLKKLNEIKKEVNHK
ncbi:MAG: hypothetical protein CSB16_01045 [Clostridiales bacterium]|nr:MAG: hypothetical protein CSB16_01045 [Clostridiales bacterium]